jgi:DNA (cytosine-5)-methyltransferase 1
MGYQRAGFEVVGVDISPQPNYPFAFAQADVIEFLRDGGAAGFDAIHASPPCQRYSYATPTGHQNGHQDLVAATRELLQATGLPYVIENLLRSPIRRDLILCGTALGLTVRRHRAFELSFASSALRSICQHGPDNLAFDHGVKQLESAYRDAMGCEWMSVKESREAIPPVYTEFIASRLVGMT